MNRYWRLRKYGANANTKKNERNKVGRSRMPKHPTPPGFPSFLGGDPSAGSPTDTLLRLNPPRRRQARIPHREVASPTHN